MTSLDDEGGRGSPPIDTIDDDEPIIVAFHESPEETPPIPNDSLVSPSSQTASATPAPLSQPSKSAWAADEEKDLDVPASHVLDRTTAVLMPNSHSVVILPAGLPTIKAVNINTILPAPPHPAAPATFAFPTPPANSVPTRPPLASIADSVMTSSYLYSPSSSESSGRISAYAVSLLSSGSIFRSYRLNTTTNQIEFQDIKLYALFPPHLTNHSATPTHQPPSPAQSRGTAVGSLPTEPTLYWGPPGTRTSGPSSSAMAVIKYH